MAFWKSIFGGSRSERNQGRPAKELRVEDRTDIRSAVFHLPQKAIASKMTDLQKDMLREVLGGTCQRIVVVCSDTDYMDSAMLRLLCTVDAEAAPRHIPIVLVGVRGKLKDLFRITRLDKKFSLIDTIDDVIERPGKPLGLFTESHPAAPYRKHDLIAANWEVLGVLNKGGMGVIYLVQDRSNGNLRVLKTLLDEHLRSAYAKQRFLQESRIWSVMEPHLFIVKAFSAFEYQGRPYIELEYVLPDQVDSSVTLRDRICSTGGPLPLRRVVRWGIQFCIGMQHAQEHGVKCHRDVKPENLLVARHQLMEDGVEVFSSRLRIIKISDFGLSKAADIGTAMEIHNATGASYDRSFSLSITGGFCGTPPYMPPEQFGRADEADIRSDIYSFGVVLYELVTGHRPFVPDRTVDDPIAAWYQLHVSQRPLRINSPLWPIVEKCLQKAPESRFQSVKELKVELDALDRQIDDQWSFPYPF